MKGFVYFSAGMKSIELPDIRPDCPDKRTRQTSWLYVRECTEECLRAVLASHAWMNKKKDEYDDFIKNAKVGEMWTFYDSEGDPMVAIVRLCPQPDWEPACDAAIVKEAG